MISIACDFYTPQKIHTNRSTNRNDEHNKHKIPMREVFSTCVSNVKALIALCLILEDRAGGLGIGWNVVVTCGLRKCSSKGGSARGMGTGCLSKLVGVVEHAPNGESRVRFMLPVFTGFGDISCGPDPYASSILSPDTCLGGVTRTVTGGWLGFSGVYSCFTLRGGSFEG